MSAGVEILECRKFFDIFMAGESIIEPFAEVGEYILNVSIRFMGGSREMLYK
jgi:hypothetical protein